MTPQPGGTTPPPLTSCNFESPSICGWTQDKNDQFDWTRDNGGTASSGTGPTIDHTSGTQQGTKMKKLTFYICSVNPDVCIFTYFWVFLMK